MQLGAVLERYSDNIIREVSSPLTGIQRHCKFPPTIAEVAEMCDELSARAERIAKLGKLRLDPCDRTIGRHRANVFVPPEAYRYQEMLERAKTGDPQEWRYDDKRVGIWVALGWLRGDMGGIGAQSEKALNGRASDGR